jgi:hypothetical protein
MRRAVSVSLGSPSRDWQADLSELGVPLRIERRGVGLDYEKYTAALRELDADEETASIGLGGINRYLFSGEQKYGLRKAEEMAAVVHHKPVCDGSGLKQYWEPEVVRTAVKEGALTLQGRRALMVCAVDRWGMAEALVQGGAELVVGDFMFALGIPIALRSLQTARKVTRALLPFISRHVPFEWLYPTGESRDTPRYRRWYDWADILAGDWKFIGKYMPQEPGSLRGKTVLTNTTTPKDVDALRERGAEVLITTTPSLQGRSFGTNAVEAAVAAISGRDPEGMRLEDYLSVFRPLGWEKPRIQRLQGAFNG